MKTEIKLSDGTEHTLHLEEFDKDISTDDLTRIDYQAIQAECITIPALINRVGIWLAEQEMITSKAKLQRDVVSERRAEHHRATLIKNGVSKPTGAKIDSLVTLDPLYQEAVSEYLKEVRNEGVIKALYEAVKDKSSHLKRLNGDRKLTPLEFENELLLEKINGIVIKKK